jgi:hypothetical protein
MPNSWAARWEMLGKSGVCEEQKILQVFGI